MGMDLWVNSDSDGWLRIRNNLIPDCVSLIFFICPGHYANKHAVAGTIKFIKIQFLLSSCKFNAERRRPIMDVTPYSFGLSSGSEGMLI